MKTREDKPLHEKKPLKVTISADATLFRRTLTRTKTHRKDLLSQMQQPREDRPDKKGLK
jgi:hypothetical protein